LTNIFIFLAQPREPALCQLHRHTFVPCGRTGRGGCMKDVAFMWTLPWTHHLTTPRVYNPLAFHRLLRQRASMRPKITRPSMLIFVARLSRTTAVLRPYRKVDGHLHPPDKRAPPDNCPLGKGAHVRGGVCPGGSCMWGCCPGGGQMSYRPA